MTSKLSPQVAETRIQDLMSRHVVSIGTDDTVHEAIQLMVENRVSAVPVVDHRENVVGIISTSDLIQLTHELDEEIRELDDATPFSREWHIQQLESGENRKVREFMTDAVETIMASDDLLKAARELSRHRVHHLPVVDGQGRLQGILSSMDIVEAIAKSDS